jgi:uncharacterized protein (TIGR02246 family)
VRLLRPAVPLALALVLAVSATGSGGTPRDELSAHELTDALHRYERWTRALAGDSIASLFAPDGELLREDGGTLRGPVAIAAFLAGFSGVHVDSAVMTLEAMQLMGDDAVQWGTFAQTVRVDGQGTIRARGRFVWQWRRDGEGHWRLRRSLTQSFPR